MAERREPTFHGGRQDDGHHAGAGQAAHVAHTLKSASHFTRFISGFQAISTLIGVPLALASGYTLYRTNFAPDATCGNLRASIVSMLDKNVDPATRRALVKRDIEAFEANCGAVDPDAHSAFKALLAVDKGVAQAAPAAKLLPAPKPVALAVAKETPKADPKPEVKPEAAKVELRPAIAEPKMAESKASETKAAEPKIAEPKTVAAAPPETAEQAPMSDTRWLDAVRQALVDQPAEVRDTAAVASAPVKMTARPEPVLPNKPGEPVLQPNWTVATPAMHGQAAPLPPAVAVSDIQRAPANPNRPVPPAAVPEAQYAHGGSWVAQIPFVGRMIDRSGD